MRRCHAASWWAGDNRLPVVGRRKTKQDGQSTFALPGTLDNTLFAYRESP